MLKYGEGMPACVGLRVGRRRGWVLRAGLPVRAGGDRCLLPVVRRVGPPQACGSAVQAADHEGLQLTLSRPPVSPIAPNISQTCTLGRLHCPLPR